MLDDANNRGYSLRLANGQAWHLISTRDTGKIVDMAASIMRLQPGALPGARRLIFTASDMTQMEFSKTLSISNIPGLKAFPDHGWQPSKSGHVTIWSHPYTPDLVCEVSDLDVPKLDFSRLVLSLYPILHEAIITGGLLFHTALLEYCGKGILITAKSGTGKSTCSSRVSPPWHAVCDDQALIVRTTGGYRVHPLPTWSDYYEERGAKTWAVNEHLPLSAIFFLEQSERDEVEPVGSGKAAHLIFETSKYMYYRYTVFADKGENAKTSRAIFNNSCALSTEIPSYVLRASLEGSFDRVIEKALNL